MEGQGKGIDIVNISKWAGEESNDRRGTVDPQESYALKCASARSQLPSMYILISLSLVANSLNADVASILRLLLARIRVVYMTMDSLAAVDANFRSNYTVEFSPFPKHVPRQSCMQRRQTRIGEKRRFQSSLEIALPGLSCGSPSPQHQDIYSRHNQGLFGTYFWLYMHVVFPLAP